MTLTRNPFSPTISIQVLASSRSNGLSSPPLKVLDTHDPLVSAEEAGHGSSAKRWVLVRGHGRQSLVEYSSLYPELQQCSNYHWYFGEWLAVAKG